MPKLPSDFSRKQFEELRLLLIIAIGQGIQISKYVDPNLVPRQQIFEVLKRSSMLDFRKPDRPKLSALYDGMFRALARDNDIAGIHGLIEPMLKRVYDSNTIIGPASAVPLEDRLDQIHGPPSEDVARRLLGIFILHRHGTGQKDGGEVVTSVLRVFHRLQNEQPQLHFEIAYPIRSQPKGDNEVMITGRVFMTASHLHFVGYDKGSDAPCLLVTFRERRTTITTEFFGLSLRTTTNGVAFSSRVYGRRLEGTWQEALELPEIRSSAQWKLDSGCDDGVIEYIDGAIDNEKNFILRLYER